MMEKKESFILYKSFCEPLIKRLNNEQLGCLFRAIIEWQIDGLSHELDQEIAIVFDILVDQFKRDNEKYHERCVKNRDNVLKRWGNTRSYTTEYDRMRPNTNHSDNDNVKDNDNDSKMKSTNLVYPYKSQEFIDTWNELRTQPKWKRKSVSALQKSLDQLGRYQEEYAIILMDQAIANNYQGVVFPNTSAMYENWKKNNPGHIREGHSLMKEDLV